MHKHLIHSILTIAVAAASLPALLASSSDSNAATDQSGSDRPVTSQDIDALKQEISDSSTSSVEGIFNYHHETGDLNNRLDLLRYGGQVNYRVQGGTVLYVRGTGTSFLTTGRVFDEQGFNLTGGIRTSLSDAVDLQFEGGGSRFSNGGTTVNAMGTVRYKIEGGSELHFTGSRTNVEESLLSAAGVQPGTGPFANQIVGEVMDNRFVGGGVLKITHWLDLFGEGGGGQRTGQHIESNAFRVADGGAGVNVVSAPADSQVSLLRFSYNMDYLAFDKNLLGYGGASLLGPGGLPVAVIGGDGVSPLATPGNPGLGGYFSPPDFLSQVGRVEVQGKASPGVDYHFSGFAGYQDFTGATNHKAAGVFGSVTLRLNDRFSLPITYVLDNFGPFVQQTLFVRLAVKL